MQKEEFYFDSKDRKTKIRAMRYIPEGEVRAVLQIAHGMVEFIDRYEGFASYLCDRGYLVTGNDHLGHGASVNSKDDWGYFCENDGYKVVMEDMHELTRITKGLYPGVPYFLLGHSMGSFLCRYYLIEHGDELDAAIVMGTGQQTKGMLSVAKALTTMIGKSKGWRHRSPFINSLALGSYNKEYEPSKTHCDWLTKDQEIVEWYAHEPRCQFLFTTNGYYNLFGLIGEIIDKDKVARMPKDLPVLITSGAKDPVGNSGKDPKAVEEMFKRAGMKDVSLKLYDNDRHEILNETDKDRIYEDIYEWLESKRVC